MITAPLSKIGVTGSIGMNIRPHIVIIGAGFGGLAAAMKLAGNDVRVTLIDRQNHHLFQPLLYQLATASVDASAIAWPVRALFRKHSNVDCLMGEITGIDTDRKCVLLKNDEVHFDQLIIATGNVPNYFGNAALEKHTLPLKKLEHALDIRNRVLGAFERCEHIDNSVGDENGINFVIVGGGPAGVETAGAVAELTRQALKQDFKNIDPKKTRIILIEAGERILAAFHPKLSDYSRKALEKMGVEIWCNRMVVDCDEYGLTIDDEYLPAESVIWAAGIVASPAAKWLGIETDRSGRIAVDDNLQIKGFNDIYAIGDLALVTGKNGQPLPGLAPVAKQQGKYVAKRILTGEKASAKPFKYFDGGIQATIGRDAAIIQYGRFRLTGRLAWWAWSMAHIYFLITVRSRLSMFSSWLWSCFTMQRHSRLIIGRGEN